LPECQKKGIGKSLINEGLSLLEQLDGQGCAVVGDPNNYIRFGFKNFPELVHEGVPQAVFREEETDHSNNTTRHYFLFFYQPQWPNTPGFLSWSPPLVSLFTVFYQKNRHDPA